MDAPSDRDRLAAIFKPAAEEFLGKLNFAFVDAKLYGTFAENLHLNPHVFPAFAIEDVSEANKYAFNQHLALNETNIQAFLMRYRDGTLLPTRKIEYKMRVQHGPVVSVDDGDYEQIVLDDEKDVLVEFYAPWCGACKR